MPKEGKWNCSTHKADGNRIFKHHSISCKHILNSQNFLLSPQRDNFIEESFSVMQENLSVLENGVFLSQCSPFGISSVTLIITEPLRLEESINSNSALFRAESATTGLPHTRPSSSLNISKAGYSASLDSFFQCLITLIIKNPHISYIQTTSCFPVCASCLLSSPGQL